ncbi:hypothetical protein ACGFRB_22825 [Streptomyces sp. NPDC048718]|uniref:hypothetical protein n=1 Tax=Streptomyces sp. NPDC048718 TaxID=3365587 RepID=UPI0037131B4C
MRSSSVKNTIAVLVRVMEQAVRDNVIKINPARVTGWQKLYKQAEAWASSSLSLAAERELRVFFSESHHRTRAR